jgi:hypothetical protein
LLKTDMRPKFATALSCSSLSHSQVCWRRSFRRRFLESSTNSWRPISEYFLQSQTEVWLGAKLVWALPSAESRDSAKRRNIASPTTDKRIATGVRSWNAFLRRVFVFDGQ